MMITSDIFRFAVVLGAGLMLSACGETKTERALSGGAIGAGAGAVATQDAGGAILGGAAGAAAGALTDGDTINPDKIDD